MALWGRWARRRVAAVAAALAALAIGSGCGGETSDRVLAVDLRTDYVPGTEFTSVRAELRRVDVDGGSTRTTNEVPVRLGDDFTRGRRLTDFPVREAGSYLLRVTLLQLGGEPLAARNVRLQVRGGRNVTVVVTRACATVSCPPPDGPPELTACLGGRCVSPECTPENPDACGEASCSGPEDCPRPADCADALCVDGTCLVAPRSGGCPEDTWCHPERGCVALPEGDADGGSGCEAAPETCNGLDDDCDGETDEDFDLQGDPRNCGECGRSCGGEHATARCEAGRCVLACDEGYADCDGDPSNGCEAALSSPESCGGCGTRCEGGTPLCVLGADGRYACVSECPPEAPTLCSGSCADTASSLAHCGGCDRPCEVAHGTPECNGGSCRLAACDPGWGDCDGDPDSGCETDLTTPSDCGRCGAACPPARPYCVPDGSGGYGCTDGCADGVRGGDESDVDCGGSLCAPCGEGQRCNVDRDCGAALVCRGGRCVPCGECVPGETQSQACGNCGTQSRSCTASCVWGSWGPCSGEGVCAPGTTDTRPCGNCGTQSRSCTSSCSWGSWGACTGEGVCSPGTTETTSCGRCGTQSRSCNAACGWDGWSACTGEGVCTPGETQSQACGNCGTRSRSCTSSCSWGSWGACTGEGVCSPGQVETQACGNCGTQSRSCTSSCSWGSWGACTGEGVCSPGSRSSSGCPNPCMAKSCSTSCSWSAECSSCNPSCSRYTTPGYSCPNGYYIERYSSSLGGTQVTCRPACGDAFQACGYSCPSGYYIDSYSSTLACGTSGSGTATNCRRITGTQFTACGFSCPSGYYVSRRTTKWGCSSSGGSGDAVVCRKM